MVQRWAVAALLRAEKKFKRVKGYREIPELIVAMGKKILTLLEISFLTGLTERGLQIKI
jgi:hypothetical protein